MVCAGARFHPDDARRLLGEKGDHIGTGEFSAKNGYPAFVYTVNLEYRLGQIEADRDNGHDFLHLLAIADCDPLFGGGPCHQMGCPARPLHDTGKRRPNRR